MPTAAALGTRAVMRRVNPGELALCAGCDEAVKFQAQRNNQRVIANVYEHHRWHRVEVWHPSCYEDAGSPHGEALP